MGIDPSFRSPLSGWVRLVVRSSDKSGCCSAAFFLQTWKASRIGICCAGHTVKSVYQPWQQLTSVEYEGAERVRSVRMPPSFPPCSTPQAFPFFLSSVTTKPNCRPCVKVNDVQKLDAIRDKYNAIERSRVTQPFGQSNNGMTGLMSRYTRNPLYSTTTWEPRLKTSLVPALRGS